MTDSWQQQKDEFNRLCDLWDNAQNKGIFKPTEVDQTPKSDFFGNYTVQEKSLDSDDASYWTDVITRSGKMFPDETTVLMEAALNEAKAKKKAKKAKDGTGKVEKKAGQYQVDGGKPLNDLVKTSLEKAGKLDNGEKAVGLANNPNPIYPDTVGPDAVDKENKVKVTAGLAAHPAYPKLEKLKRDLYNLEVEMNTKTGLNEKKASSFKKKFENLRNQIEKISNSLGGSFKDGQYHA